MIRKLISRILKRRMPPSVEPCTPVYELDSSAEILPAHPLGLSANRVNFAAMKVVRGLQEKGFVAYIVGGAVRDLLLNLNPKDFDVATNATPEQVNELFRRSRIIGRRFKIVHVMFGRETIEVTTFRGGNTGTQKNAEGRITSDNTYGTEAEDALRRDFTVNALFYDPIQNVIIDYHQGLQDLEHRVLKMIGEPAKRYEEDPVRLLRAIRLASKLDFTIEDATKAPMAEYASRLKNEPAARLFEEMLKLLMCGYGYKCLMSLREEGLIQGNFPLLDALMEEDSRHHDFVRLVLESTDDRIREGKSISPGFLLAALLWGQVNDVWQQQKARGEKNNIALMNAMNQVEPLQEIRFAIPKRLLALMREIWALQIRFDSRVGNRPFKLLEQERFRAAFDFLALRAKVGQVDEALVVWWQAFQVADIHTRALMCEEMQQQSRHGAKKIDESESDEIHLEPPKPKRKPRPKKHHSHKPKVHTPSGHDS